MDAANPPASVVDAYLQVAETRTRRWASIPWGDGEHDAEEDYSTELAQRLVTSATCEAGKLEHFYTSKRRGKLLCAPCYQRRVLHPARPKGGARMNANMMERFYDCGWMPLMGFGMLFMAVFWVALIVAASCS